MFCIVYHYKPLGLHKLRLVGPILQAVTVMCDWQNVPMGCDSSNGLQVVLDLTGFKNRIKVLHFAKKSFQ